LIASFVPAGYSPGHFSLPLSNKHTDCPVLAILLAATPPPYPEPITTTSYDERRSSTGLEMRGNAGRLSSSVADRLEQGLADGEGWDLNGVVEAVGFSVSNSTEGERNFLLGGESKVAAGWGIGEGFGVGSGESGRWPRGGGVLSRERLVKGSTSAEERSLV